MLGTSSMSEGIMDTLFKTCRDVMCVLSLLIFPVNEIEEDSEYFKFGFPCTMNILKDNSTREK